MKEIYTLPFGIAGAQVKKKLFWSFNKWPEFVGAITYIMH